MNHYRTSTGERVSKATIDRRIREAKAKVLDIQQELYGYNFCVECYRNASGTRLDCSHDISVDRCQKTGRAELAWDVNNIKVRCRGCHSKKDGLMIMSVKITN